MMYTHEMRHSLWIVFVTLLACSDADSPDEEVTIDAGQVELDARATQLDASGDAGNSVAYQQGFDGTDDSPWPSEWRIPEEPNSPLTEVSVQGERGYLAGASGGSRVTRMVMSDFQATDFEALFSIQFESMSSQGIGFYGRQNGGRLQGTIPPGQGYAVFIEGYTYGDELNLTLWHELDGDENKEASQRMMNLPASNDNRYRVRFRVEQSQMGVATTMSASMWPENSSEPPGFQVETVSSSADLPGLAVLQDLRGGFAIDVYNVSEPGGIYIDDISIVPLSP